MNRFSQRMNKVSVAVKVLLRPAFAALLAISQVTSRRGTIFTPDALVLTFGIPITIAGVDSGCAPPHASRRCGDPCDNRPLSHHPPPHLHQYVSDLHRDGPAFFAWLWFVVLLAFAPLWWPEARREEEAIAAAYGEAYTAYRARTATFVPWIW